MLYNYDPRLQFQFVLGIIVYGGTLFSNCADRKHGFLCMMAVTQYSYLIYMFGKFYLQNYLGISKKKQQ